MPKWLKGAIAVAVAGAAGLAGFVWFLYWATSGLIEPIERQLTALKAGDIEAAYAETSEAFHQGTTKDEFDAFVEKFPILKSAASHSFPSRSIENGIGAVSGSLISPTGG